MARLCLLFFLSGASGLIYQIVWVREFGNVFGNTIHSASLVIGVFMSGLGLGGYAAGVWADRRYESRPHSLLRAYGLFELAIAALGLAISLLLPRLGDLAAATSAYTREAGGWYTLSTGSYAARYGVAVIVLLPITLLMGGTFTVLIRHSVQRRLDLAGWKVGALYGVNTAGAALGCFVTDYTLVPAGGLRAAQMTAVAFNLIAAAGALRLARGEPAAAMPATATAPAATPAAPIAAAAPAGRATSLTSLTGLALLGSGFAAMGMEVVWFRHLSALIGAYRSVLSLILTVILAALCVGALAGGALSRRFGRPAVFYAAAQALFVIAALAALAGADIADILREFESAADAFRASSGARREALRFVVSARPLLRELAIPALLMGFAYPLANACIQRLATDVGRRAGLLYLANTAGAVLGSLAVGFVLLPAVGMQRTVTVLAFVAAIGLVPFGVAMGRGADRRAVRTAFGAAIVAVAAAIAVWMTLPADHVVARTLPPLRAGERRLAVSEGVNEIVSVTEMPNATRRLVTNGHSMSGTELTAQRYMRAFAHIPLLQMERPRRVLVICFGVGNTLHAASLHPSVERLEVVDLSRAVLEHARFFASTNGDVIHAPKVAVYVNDGRHHLRMQASATYDLITLEPPPIAFAGVASLYSREFYELARSRLTPHGYITQWLPAYQVPGAATLAAIRAFIEVFPRAVLLSGSMSELILMGAVDGDVEIDPARLAARLRAAPRVAEDMRRVHLGTPTEVIGIFAGSMATLSAATALHPALTDDYPILEYALASRLMDHRIPDDLFDVTAVASWCPRCFVKGEPVTGLEALPDYLRFFGSFYRDPVFLRASWPSRPAPGGHSVSIGLDDARMSRVIAASPYLQSLGTRSPRRSP